MSRDKKVSNEVASGLPSSVQEVMTQSSSSVPTGPEKLTDVDRLTLELAKAKRQIAVAEAKTSIANNENAELNYKYLVLQIYMKYGLTTEDAISEAGDIIRGGAKPRNQ